MMRLHPEHGPVSPGGGVSAINARSVTFVIAVAVAATILVPGAGIAADIAVGVRAGDPLYRELRLAANLGLLDGPLRGQEPLSRSETFRLLAPLNAHITRETGILPVRVDPARGVTASVAARLTRARDVVNPWDVFWEDRIYPTTFDMDLYERVALEGSDVTRGTVAPHYLDFGYDRTEGAALVRDGMFFIEGEGLALSAYARLRFDREAVTYRPLVLAAHGGWGNVRITLGREPVAWGSEVHGGLLLSTNARPLDQLRVESDRPFRLPGPLRHLGTLTASALVGKLDDPDRADARSPWLVGARGTVAPAPWLVLGATRTTLLGGEGSGYALTWDSLADLLLMRNANRVGSGNVYDTDHKLALDWSLYLWPLGRSVPVLDGGRFYGTYGGEDSPQEGPLPSATGTTYGIELVARGVLLRAEASNVRDDSNLWYWHRLYTDGYTYRGRVMGHPMGGDSRAQSYDLEVPLGTWGLATATMERQEHGFFAEDGIPGKPVEGPLPKAVQDLFTVGVERFVGRGVGSLLLEGRVLREWGTVEALGPLESWGVSLVWRR